MSIIAVLIGLCSLALSVVALTLAVVLHSGALTYLTVALVLLGANGIIVSLANAAHRPSALPGPVNPRTSSSNIFAQANALAFGKTDAEVDGYRY